MTFDDGNKLMLVSVIMSVKNASLTIEKSIESILSQTYEKVELLILDDCSSDDTKKILDKYKDVSNIKIFKNKVNLGLTKSLNSLIKLTNGNLVARQDADDFSHKQRIEKQVSMLIKKDLDFVSCRANIINSSRVIPSYSYYLPKKFIIHYKNPFIHGTLLIKKTVLTEIGGYNEKFYYSQDYKLMFDLIEKNKKFKILKDPLYFLNMSENISQLYKHEQKYYADCVKKRIEPEKINKD